VTKPDADNVGLAEGSGVRKGQFPMSRSNKSYTSRAVAGEAPLLTKVQGLLGRVSVNVIPRAAGDALKAFARYCNPDGSSIFPGDVSAARQARVCDRQLRRHKRLLERLGVLVFEKWSHGGPRPRSTVFRIDLERLAAIADGAGAGIPDENVRSPQRRHRTFQAETPDVFVTKKAPHLFIDHSSNHSSTTPVPPPSPMTLEWAIADLERSYEETERRAEDEMRRRILQELGADEQVGAGASAHAVALSTGQKPVCVRAEGVLPRGRARKTLVEEPGFEEFIAAYPNKLDPGRARRAWRDNVGPDEAADVMVGLAAWNAYWTKRNQPEYVPHAKTWLQNRRWQVPPPRCGSGSPIIEGMRRFLEDVGGAGAVDTAVAALSAQGTVPRVIDIDARGVNEGS
jgi:hypothetical protein